MCREIAASAQKHRRDGDHYDVGAWHLGIVMARVRRQQINPSGARGQ